MWMKLGRKYCNLIIVIRLWQIVSWSLTSPHTVKSLETSGRITSSEMHLASLLLDLLLFPMNAIISK